MDLCGKELTEAYCSRLLDRFMDDNTGITADWRIYYDARGHFIVPHTGNVIQLGTADILKRFPADLNRGFPWVANRQSVGGGSVCGGAPCPRLVRGICVSV